jgi:hypothetical protein
VRITAAAAIDACLSQNICSCLTVLCCLLLLVALLHLQTPYVKLSENSWAVRLSRGALAFTYDI